jgi:hypothetical protein
MDLEVDYYLLASEIILISIVKVRLDIKALNIEEIYYTIPIINVIKHVCYLI